MKESNHTIDKKVQKLLALLLASSIALMNVAPAYGTDIFTDPDNAVNEDVISVPEELDNNEEFNDTEDEFTSEQTDDDFFSDEKGNALCSRGGHVGCKCRSGNNRQYFHIFLKIFLWPEKGLFPSFRVWESTADLTAGTGQILNILLTIQMKQEIFTLLPGKIRLYMMPPAIPILMLPM